MLQPAHNSHRIGYHLLFASALLASILISNAQGQTTAFTYQGKLSDNGNPASGQYDFQFKLFDTATVDTGTQQGSAVTVLNVTVTAGSFTVQLDFGAVVFPGTERYLEISLRPASSGSFTMLSPRQAVTSTPYALRSATAGTADTATNATQLGGLQASGFIQNTTSPQAATNFNIGGTGTATIFNATGQFNLEGNRVLSSAGTNNLFVGFNTGAMNTGSNNSFFGPGAGSNNTTGSGNVFIGPGAGSENTIGTNNTAIGRNARIGGVLNFATAIGAYSRGRGEDTITLGKSAGTYDGVLRNADKVIIPGYLDVLEQVRVNGSSGVRVFGGGSGSSIVAYVVFGDGDGFEDIGYVGDGSSTDRDMYLTSYAGNVHIYTPIGYTLTATSTGSVLLRGGSMHSGNHSAQSFDAGNFKGIWSSTAVLGVGGGFDTILASPVQVCARVVSLGGGFGGYALVRCTSSLSSATNKTDLRSFSGGLDIIRRLTPVSFRWKQDKTTDLGLNADEVAEIAPELVTRNPQGEADEVKGNALSVVFINAFKQQQKQIEAQQDQINKQQQQINALKRFICTENPEAEVCKAK
jgi:hypothetical protein